MVKPLAILLRGVAAAVVALVALQGHSDTAQSHHSVYLPLVPNTPLMQQVIRAQEYNWCADARASSYPSFLTQLRDVADEYTQRTGIKHRQVDFASADCHVRHVMPDGITCNGWAGRIYYANRVVDVEYCWTLGYTDWRTTHGHELGHGLLGLHEQYQDDGSITCLRDRTWTVMSCGTGVRYPQPLDVDRGCAIIKTAWCGQAPEPPPITYPYWDGSRWRFEDGRSYRPIEGTCGEWYNAANQLVMAQCDDAWGGRYVKAGSNDAAGVWLHRGTPVYTFDEWWSVP